jgi:hypothetical protein
MSSEGGAQDNDHIWEVEERPARTHMETGNVGAPASNGRGRERLIEKRNWLIVSSEVVKMKALDD